MNIIDSHTHLFLEEFADDLPEVITRAKAAGVTHLFMPNIDSSTVGPLLQTCAGYPGYCFPMIGLHPTSVNETYQDELAKIFQALKSESDFVAVGEIGMDLYWDQTFLKEQQEVLCRQLEWALEYHLPVVLHCREAFKYVYDTLRPYAGTSLRGIFHSFTGTCEEAEQILSLPNFWIGVNGVVTFKKSLLPEVLSTVVPLDRMVLETDSPYLAPVPHRGKRNESAFVKDTLMKVAEIYGLMPEAVAKVTSENALKVFGMLK
ncbi:MAG: TatD family hydrolase [Candidatus Coprenecus sp.]